MIIYAKGSRVLFASEDPVLQTVLENLLAGPWLASFGRVCSLSDFGKGVSWFWRSHLPWRFWKFNLGQWIFLSLCTVQKVVQSPWCIHSLMPACNCPVFILWGEGGGMLEVQFPQIGSDLLVSGWQYLQEPFFPSQLAASCWVPSSASCLLICPSHFM